MRSGASISSADAVRRLAAAYAVLVAVAAVHLVARVVAPEARVAELTQPLLMPALAAVLVLGTDAPRGRLVRLVLLALAFSWLGDTVPRFVAGDGGFLAMVGFFLLAQLAYIAAFWPRRERSVAQRPPWLLPYLVALLVLLLLCYEAAGGLLLPVVVYGVALVTMAVLSTGLGVVAGLGGAIFLVSDALIALDAFADLGFPVAPFWVMATYLLGQSLLVLAVRENAEQAERTPKTGGAAAAQR